MIKSYLKLIRLIQWIKNVFLFVPLIFSKHLFDQNYVLISFRGFFAFCFASSIVYIINDIADRNSDANHPIKKNRPIASGKISISKALIIVVVLFIILTFWSIGLDIHFIFLLAVYFIINTLYSFVLKNHVILDIFSIAAGFMIRVTAGAFLIDVEISSWLILTTMFLSLFLAVMKRRSELVIVSDDIQNHTRKVLKFYSIGFIDQMATVASAGVIICYALYSVSTRTVSAYNTENLIYTTPFVVFGIFRYMFLVIQNNKGENTSEIMMSDLPMIINIIVYCLVTVLIVYKI